MFKKELLEIKGKLIWGLVIFCLLAAALPLLYPLVTSVAVIPLPPDALNTVPPSVREEMLKGIERMRQDYAFYLWSQWAGKNLPQAGIALALILGMGVIANEYRQKTALFLLAKPISRVEILATKFVAGITCLGIIVFASTLVMLLTARLTGQHPAWGNQIVLAVPSFFGATLVFALTAFFSSLAPAALPAAISGLGVTLCSVSTPYLLRSNTFNILYHMAGIRLFEEGVFPAPFILACLGLTVVFFLLALFFFSRREVL